MKTKEKSTSAVRISSTSYQTYSDLLNSQSKSALAKDGIIPERAEREWTSETYLARSSSGLISSNRLGTPLLNIIQSMLHFPGLASGFSYRFVASPYREKKITKMMQIAVNDFANFAFVLEGAASIAEMISRYAIFEELYLQSASSAANQLKGALVQLYAATMIYLSKAKSYFDQNPGSKYRCLNVRISADQSG